MKIKGKFSILFSTLCSVLLVFCMLFSTACSNTGDSSQQGGEAKIASLTLSGQKTSFDYGESFSTGNLSVKAIYTDKSEKNLSASEYNVDSSAYNQNNAGYYAIIVRANGSSVNSSYTVKVAERSILPDVPVTENGIYAYNGLDSAFNDYTVAEEPGIGYDVEWYGRYSVSVYAPGDEENKQEVGLVAAWSQIHGSQLGLSTLGRFDFNGTVVVRITAAFAFETVDIRPLSLGIEYSRVESEENTIEFTLTRPCDLSIEFDGDLCKNLMLFTDYLKSYSCDSDEFITKLKHNSTNLQNVIVVEPGTVNVSKIYSKYSENKQNVIVFGKGLYYLQSDGFAPGQSTFEIPSDAIVYIHGDAAIYGFFRVTNGKNVKIEGKGLISGQKYGSSQVLKIENSQNITTEGIVLFHSNGWTNVLIESQDIVYRNVHVAGSRQNNNDGFDMCNSSDVLIDNCFIRTIDDCITVKCGAISLDVTRPYVENIIVQNCTLWNYQGGNPIVVGSESCTDVYNNLVFRNIDIIHNNSGRALAVEILDSAKVTNVVFDDIRLDLTSEYGKDSNDNPAPTHTYNSDMGNTSPLVQVELITNEKAFYGRDTYDGTISGVIFNNITFNGNSERGFLLKGTGSDNQVSDILFNNFSYNGTILNDYNSTKYLTSGSANYTGVSFTSGNYYFKPDTTGVLIDDADMKFIGADKYSVSDANLTGGGYSDFNVLLGSKIISSFNVANEGYYMPYVNLKTGATGGLFDVAFDGEYVGSVNTYSLTSEYMQYYLPLDFISAGEHTVSFTARSIPNANYDGGILSIGVDYVNFVNMGSNRIEFEMLSSASTRVADGHASGGMAVDFSLEDGQELTFSGNNVRARDTQLVLSYLAGPDKGIYKFYYNGKLISGNIDMYSEKSEYKEIKLDTVSLLSGPYTITAKCVGKNENATDTNARLDCLRTIHLAVSITQKAGYEGFYNAVTVSEGITISTGYFQPVKIGNIKQGGTITSSNNLKTMSDGVYEYRVVLDNYDDKAFDFYFNGKSVDYKFENDTITFVTAQRCNEPATILRFVCKGAGTYAFDIVKVEVVPYEVNKVELRDLVYAEDERVFENTDEYLIEEHAEILRKAKDVLFSRLSLQKEVDIAAEALSDVASRVENGAVRYNIGTLENSEVRVSFDNVENDELAVLYLEQSGNTAVYYALVNNNEAIFNVDEQFLNKEVKLYCQVIGNEFAAPTISQGEKISSAQVFEFSDSYYTAETTNAFGFDNLSGCNTLKATFSCNEVKKNDVAMLTIRNLKNETLATVYATIDANGIATFTVPEITQNKVVAIIRVSGKPNVTAQSLQALGVKTADFELGKAIINGISDGKVSISSTVTPDSNGVISYPARSGWKSATIVLTYDGIFDKVELDMSILRYCGSGGPDSVYIKSASGKVLDVCSASENGLKSGSYCFTYDECGGKIILELWYGCVGDHEQCLAEPPHANEEIRLNGVRFFTTADGQTTSFKLVGNNPIVIGDVKAFNRTYIDTLAGAQNLTAKGDFAVGDTVSLVLKNAGNETVATLNSVCNSNGIIVFDVSQVAYTGKVYAYFIKSNGDSVAADVDVTVNENFHLGKALYNLSSDSEAWDIAKLNGTMNINENGIIYNDTVNYFRYNYWITTESRPLEGYDYSFTCKEDLSALKSVSIAYSFNKVCNCGGMDWFYIVNNGTVVGSFSCQDMAAGVYGGTIVLDETILKNCTSQTFYIFYGFGCSNNTHTDETLEFGAMTVERKAITENETVVFTNVEQFPTYINEKGN